MRYQIDQSIKIENTSKPTYVSLTNGKAYTVAISANEKRLFKEFFRKLDRPLIFKLFTFSVLCAKVIFKISPNTLEIDREYSGHEIDIKSYITQILTIWGCKNSPHIYFSNIGKKSPAHNLVYRFYKQNRKDLAVKAKEVLILYNLVNKA